MATEALKSAQITNATATPNVPNPAYQDGGRVRVKRATVTTVLAAAAAGSTYRFFKIKSNDMIKDLRIDAATLGTGAAWDIGLYNVNADGTIGSVKDVDFFASALAMAAAQSDVQILRESAVITPTNMEKRVWEILALTVDPKVEYEVVGTTETAHTAAGAVCLTMEVVGGH